MSATDISVCDRSLVLYLYHVFRPWLLEQFDSLSLSYASANLDSFTPEELEEQLPLLRL